MRITKQLREALKTYFFNADMQYRIAWDKETDLARVAVASRGMAVQAAAGTFWFSYNTKHHRVTYKTSARLFPKFERTRERRPL